ncbi:MAG: hypothetical protein P1U41_09860 [Vicingaceae bacterium]|nr:hypothetical protein [Vicingaceae bacterium]
MTSKQFSILILVFSTLVFVACSKEEKKVTPYPYTSPSYDIGHLMVKITNDNSIVDSVKYTNLAKGVTNTIDKSKMVYYPSNNYSVLSVAMASGNVGDQVRCCVYLNQSTNVGIEYKFRSADSIATSFTSSSVYCISGTY